MIDAGADEYLVKPFHMPELLARIRALIGRAAGRSAPVLTSGAIRFDATTGTATREGVPVALTRYEQRLLQFLMHRPGQIVGLTEIVENIYPQDSDRDSNTIEVFIARLRRKLGVHANRDMPWTRLPYALMLSSRQRVLTSPIELQTS